MSCDRIIAKLNQAIFEDVPYESIELLEDLLAESIEEISTNENFFDFPTENVLRIIKKSKTNDVELLRTLVQSMNAYKGEDAALILNVIDSDDGSLSDYIEIISKLKTCPICKRISDIIERDANLPKRDYEGEIKELESKIEKLESNISSLKSKPTEKLEKPEKFNDNIFSASEEGDIQSVKYLIEHCNANIESKSENGWTPLHFASRYGKLDVVRYLIEKGVNIDEKDNYRYTSLHKASFNGHIDIVRCLVDKGAKIEVKSTNGRTPLHSACDSGFLEIVIYLLDNKANIEAKDKSGCTPLHCAAKNGKFDVVKYLIEKGANIEAKNNEGKTPLQTVNCGEVKKVKEYLQSKMNK